MKRMKKAGRGLMEGERNVFSVAMGNRGRGRGKGEKGSREKDGEEESTSRGRGRGEGRRRGKEEEEVEEGTSSNLTSFYGGDELGECVCHWFCCGHYPSPNLHYMCYLILIGVWINTDCV